MSNELVLYEANPSMFRNHPVGFLLALILSLVGVGIVILTVWYVRCLGTTLTITNERTSLRRGILSKSITEVWHRDVRNVTLYQSFMQRIFDVGQIGVSSAGQADVEISVSGLPNPGEIKAIIDRHRRDA